MFLCFPMYRIWLLLLLGGGFVLPGEFFQQLPGETEWEQTSICLSKNNGVQAKVLDLNMTQKKKHDKVCTSLFSFTDL